jgi:hypothetical protein
LSDTSLAPYGNRIIRPPDEPHRTARKRLISWALVVRVHGFFLALLTANFIKQERVGQKGPIETFFDISMLHNPNPAPPIRMIKPEVENPNQPEISTAPIMIPPLKKLPEVPPESVPAKPGDVLKSVGEAIACGASHFEYLTDEQRAKCKHEPWIPRKLPNGNIVMELPPKPAEGPPELHMSGAQFQRHEMETSPGCPIMLQTPCVDDILRGRNNRAP